MQVNKIVCLPCQRPIPVHIENYDSDVVIDKHNTWAEHVAGKRHIENCKGRGGPFFLGGCRKCYEKRHVILYGTQEMINLHQELTHQSATIDELLEQSELEQAPNVTQEDIQLNYILELSKQDF